MVTNNSIYWFVFMTSFYKKKDQGHPAHQLLNPEEQTQVQQRSSQQQLQQRRQQQQLQHQQQQQKHS